MFSCAVSVAVCRYSAIRTDGEDVNDIPPELLAEVLREVEEEKGCPDEYTVPIEELFERLMAKGWRPDAPLLH
jgi:hypothetical protein